MLIMELGWDREASPWEASPSERIVAFCQTNQGQTSGSQTRSKISPVPKVMRAWGLFGTLGAMLGDHGGGERGLISWLSVKSFSSDIGLWKNPDPLMPLLQLSLFVYQGRKAAG